MFGLIFFLLIVPLQAGVIVTNSLEDILSKIEKYENQTSAEDILVVFDVNMTLIRPQTPAATEASVKKYRAIFSKIRGDLNDEEQCTLVNLPTKIGPQELVSPDLPKFIAKLQSRNIQCIALSGSLTGSLGSIKNIESYYYHLFKKLNMDFSKPSGQVAEHIVLDNLKPFRNNFPTFYKGIILANIYYTGNTKGEVLVEFIKRLPRTPKIVVFIDDKREGSINLSIALKKSIPDMKVKTFQYTQAVISSDRIATEAEFEHYWQGMADLTKKIHLSLNARTAAKDSQKPPISMGIRVPTLNKMGWIHPFVDEITSQFLKNVKNFKKPVLEIGAGYGYASKLALEKGNTVWVNDLDPRHLDILKENISTKECAHANFVPGDFPDGVDIPSNFFSAVLAVRIFHFYSPEKFERAAQKIYNALVDGGEAYIVAETPFLRSWDEQIKLYEQRKKEGDSYPGYHTSVYDHHAELKDFIPPSILFLDIETLQRVFTAVGFKIKHLAYMDRQDYPSRIRLDGRETVGLIVQKPVKD
jgi:SAM-dependent methyltransferase